MLHFNGGTRMKQIKSVLVANRGEIAIRVFRACSELGIRTVAVYSNEDALALHRYRADESYLIGEGKSPVDAYLDIDSIIQVAIDHNVDAIHPGYGFLSENSDLARRCEEEGIIFIGPKVEHLQMFGDKVNAREQAKLAQIPMIPGSDGPLNNYEELESFVNEYGLPVMIKAVNGGGGRGMRLVNKIEELKDAYNRAKSEALKAFGSDEVYVEKCIVNPKHIEVQIIGDEHGNIVHLHERDCSIQRRHQKVVEVAPAIALSTETRKAICDAAVKLMKNVKYLNAGTVEFLATEDGSFYFIEVNPRIQVEHTVTEMVTGIDIVQTQIKVAEGYALHSAEVGIPAQEEVPCAGFAIQCRITTEDPVNHFMPDTGKVVSYRSGGGFGIRLDAGNAYTGAVITPHYDSLLVKATSFALNKEQSICKMIRCLQEFRVVGVKTNLHFLINVLKHDVFASGNYNVNFIDEHPELFVYETKADPEDRLLNYIADVTVNGYTGKGREIKPNFEPLEIPEMPAGETPRGTKQLLDEMGPEKFAKWVVDQKDVLFTDTTMRDAHQSLFATRLRTADMVRVVEATSKMVPNLFSYECWGGATFDVAYRFLKEDPWERLRKIRQGAPNILLQMLLRGANAVGYTNYPDNVVQNFVHLAAKNGIDVFRIFDCLNGLDTMKVSIDAVLAENKIAEVALCYTGDILDASRTKYNLDYYVKMAKEVEKAGAHILAIKDMAGLLKPQAAYNLVGALKDAVNIPIHLHTHEGAGNAIYSLARAIDAGVDVVDGAFSAFSNGTSQPSLNTLYYALSGTDRQPDVNIENMEALSRYWATVRPYYKGIDKAESYPNTELYMHEMPGGQYSNLQQQARAVGLGDRWNEIKKTYHDVNMMFGDIIKVTPSSKVVGDMTLFMVQNEHTEEDIYAKGDTMDFPQSVVEFFEGRLGTPYGGFPEKLQKIILKGKEPIKGRPSDSLAPIDFEEVRLDLRDKNAQYDDEAISAYCLYPKVFDDYTKFLNQYGDVSILDTPTFFFGMTEGEMVEIEMEKGKALLLKLIYMSEPDLNGNRDLTFEVNGQARTIKVHDKNVEAKGSSRKKADPSKDNEIGATLSGSVVTVLVKEGEAVKKNQPLAVTEAMKMETNVTSPMDGVVKAIHVSAGEAIESGDCLLELE